MKNEKVIIIGGGVGPQAGTLLHNYIIENTLTNGTDQDHLNIYHFSRSSDIPDRTISLENGSAIEPALGMYKTFKIAAAAIDVVKKHAVGGIPCNTFHAAEIFEKFELKMNDIKPKIEIINMVEETVKEVLNNYPDIKKIGIMSTTGTRNTRVYTNPFEKKDIEVIQVSKENQLKLHNSIYNKEWGIKAITPISKKAKTNFEEFSDYLIRNGAEIIILGCTEIPIALPNGRYRDIPLIDPMVSLARALIKEANPAKLKYNSKDWSQA